MEYCRLCARTDKKPLVPILEANPLNIKEKLLKLLKIKVDEDTRLPKSICLECLTKLNQFNEFFTTSLENQVMLEIIFGEKCEIIQDQLMQKASEAEDKSSIEQIFIIEEVTAESHASNQNVTDEPTNEDPNENQFELIEQSTSQKKRKFDRFDCYLCDERLSGNLKFVQHFAEVHPTAEIRYSCFMCSNYVKKYRSYTRHLESHTDKRFSCDICERVFSQKITLIQHMNSHSNLKSYKCTECDLDFKQNSSLFKHRKQKHSKNVPSCPECLKAFVNNETLAQHMRSKHKGEKIIKCEDCAKSFASRSALIYHRSSQHQSGAASSKSCKICDKTFKTAIILSRHLRKMHQE